jgi:hypothetical protein
VAVGERNRLGAAVHLELLEDAFDVLAPWVHKLDLPAKKPIRTATEICPARVG